MYLNLANSVFHRFLVVLLTLNVGVAAFSKPTYSILAKTNEEKGVEIEEAEAEKEGQSESKSKLEENLDGPDLGSPALIARELKRKTSILLVATRKQCQLSVSHEFLYLLYHNLKIDCP
jgi:hypothetical protein